MELLAGVTAPFLGGVDSRFRFQALTPRFRKRLVASLRLSLPSVRISKSESSNSMTWSAKGETDHNRSVGKAEAINELASAWNIPGAELS